MPKLVSGSAAKYVGFSMFVMKGDTMATNGNGDDGR